jgi:uncharacterized RDD family membrane protein YckC
VLEPGAESNDGTQQRWRGERLGLPQSGPGAIASFPRRIIALWLDWMIALGVTSLFERPPGNWTVLLVWFLITAVAVGAFGFTAGHAIVGLRVARMDGATFVGFRSVVRSLLIALVIPAVVWDADGRCLHDKAAGTVVIRVR